MRRLIDLVKLDRLDNLIRHKATGSPDELAERLGLSRSSLFDIIAFLKEEMRAPIYYDRNRPSYMYEYVPRFFLGFEKDHMQTEDAYNTLGGSDKNEIKRKKVNIDDDILDDDIDFNDLYF